jgi:hypothetical protein
LQTGGLIEPGLKARDLIIQLRVVPTVQQLLVLSLQTIKLRTHTFLLVKNCPIFGLQFAKIVLPPGNDLLKFTNLLLVVRCLLADGYRRFDNLCDKGGCACIGLVSERNNPGLTRHRC